MYLIFVDFSDNNSLLTEQLDVRSFYNLSLLNKSLIEVQLTNFTNCDIQKVFLLDAEEPKHFSLFSTECLDVQAFLKRLLELDATDKALLVRNDVYFEDDFAEYEAYQQGNDIVAFSDNTGNCFALMLSVDSLRRLSNKTRSFKELFVNSSKIADSHIATGGYIKFLHIVNDYKNLLFDILNSETNFKPPYIAEGIFTEGGIPDGDFSIIPPVYLGENVQIECGSVIGPNTVVLSNTLISSDTLIKNSIICDYVYVSSHCYIDGAFCCKNSSIKRNSAVFCGSVIGENALIGEDMFVESKSVINKNVRFDKFIKSPFYNSDTYRNEFQCVSPDKAALLGFAIGKVFKKPRVILGCDASENSSAIKFALLSGLMVSGAECFDVGVAFEAYMFFSMFYCECSYSIFISGKNGGIDIEIFNSKNLPISKTDCCNVFDYIKNSGFDFAEQDNCKHVRQIHGLRKMYIREVCSVFVKETNNFPVVDCCNDLILKIFDEIKAKTENKNSQSEKMRVKINASGTKASITFKAKTYSEKALRKIVNFYCKKAQNIEACDNSYYKKLWKKDCVFLVMAIVDIIEKTGKDLSALAEELPPLFVESKTLESNLQAGDFARKLDGFDNIFLRNNEYNFSVRDAFVKVVKHRNTNELKVLCASSDVSVSKEICNSLSSLFKADNT